MQTGSIEDGRSECADARTTAPADVHRERSGTMSIFRLLPLCRARMLLVAPPLTWFAARTAARATSPCGCVDPRSLRPPLDYTSQFAKDSGPIEVTPIGWISSPYKERFGTPRQPTVNEQVSGGKLQEGEIVLAPDVSTLALRGRKPHRARTPN